MRKLNTLGLVFFVLFSMVSVGYSACEGDLNCDGDTDGVDLSLLAADFGTTGCGTCDDVISRIDELEDRIAQLEAILLGVIRTKDAIIFSGINVHVVSGTGTTDGPVNGLGNLIVGYDEPRPSGSDKTGSHNIVVGIRHNYSSFGGLVVGYYNEIVGGYATVSGGYNNSASNSYSSVSGGRDNTASGYYSSVSGGRNNTASNSYSSVSGGEYNLASGYYSSVSGGQEGIVSGWYDWRAGELFQAD